MHGCWIEVHPTLVFDAGFRCSHNHRRSGNGNACVDANFWIQAAFAAAVGLIAFGAMKSRLDSIETLQDNERLEFKHDGAALWKRIQEMREQYVLLIDFKEAIGEMKRDREKMNEDLRAILNALAEIRASMRQSTRQRKRG